MAGLYQDILSSVRAAADPRTRDWLLINDSPLYVWICSALYLLIVWQGPKFMKNRPAFNLRGFMILYNTFLVLLSAYMVFEILYSMYLNGYNPICHPYNVKRTYQNPSEMRMAKVLWWYFFSKLIEFMDTILMVLRKKNSQITFLHVFHHCSMLNIWWFCLMLVPGGQSWFCSLLNSLVHVFMYSYYLLNLFPSMRKYLWWKKYLTQFQLIQFSFILAHALNTIRTGCEYPSWAPRVLSGYMLIMLTLFCHFYLSTYLLSDKRPSATVTPIDKGNEQGGVARDTDFNVKTE